MTKPWKKMYEEASNNYSKALDKLVVRKEQHRLQMDRCVDAWKDKLQKRESEHAKELLELSGEIVKLKKENHQLQKDLGCKMTVINSQAAAALTEKELLMRVIREMTKVIKDE